MTKSGVASSARRVIAILVRPSGSRKETPGISAVLGRNEGRATPPKKQKGGPEPADRRRELLAGHGLIERPIPQSP